MRRSAIMAAVVALTVTIGASPAAAAPARYSFVDLGTLGGESSYANAINDRGQISGGHQVAGGFHGAVWQRGRVTDLGAGPFDRGNTYGINESGWVIGWQFSPTQFERGILWRAGTPTDIGTLGGELTHLTAINDRGQILGISQLPDGYTHPILWRAGTMTDLTTLGVGPDDNLVDLNNRGEIAGSYGTVSGVAHAALWRKSRPTP
jgi:probable HAF family extracellular repeat protein